MRIQQNYGAEQLYRLNMLRMQNNAEQYKAENSVQEEKKESSDMNAKSVHSNEKYSFSVVV